MLYVLTSIYNKNRLYIHYLPGSVLSTLCVIIRLTLSGRESGSRHGLRRRRSGRPLSVWNDGHAMTPAARGPGGHSPAAETLWLEDVIAHFFPAEMQLSKNQRLPHTLCCFRCYQQEFWRRLECLRQTSCSCPQGLSHFDREAVLISRPSAGSQHPTSIYILQFPWKQDSESTLPPRPDVSPFKHSPALL